MKHVVVLTGAGMSSESGLKTFRDANGLWEGHDIMEVATAEGFSKNPELVLEFYNQRRKQLLQVNPNSAHHALSALEKTHKVTIITQNVDDLHERAGSKNILHLHGELLKVRSTVHDSQIYNWKHDLSLGDLCEKGYQLRPHIVWFGEPVPLISQAIEICKSADSLLIIGTSLQVYPAASLVQYVPPEKDIFYIDPKPIMALNKHVTIISEKATTGVQKVIDELTKYN
ncbi:NAD-dependent deacylase [Flavobacteriaceae bacterium]|nr:NAD-dependent deacylase [Flavobacteriaceae bacterium]